MADAGCAMQEITGFSPNELVFSHSVRSPLAALKDSWVDAEPPKNLTDFVNGFRHRLFLVGCVARVNLQNSQNKMKKLYDRGTERQEFSPGDQVLALNPLWACRFRPSIPVRLSLPRNCPI